MTLNRILLTLPLLALLSGCVTLGGTTRSYSENENQLNQWIQEKEYGLALKALSSIDPKDPDYLKAAEKRKRVAALAAEYERKVVKRNRQRLDEGDWAAALDSYDKALERMPESVVLKDGLAHLHQRQKEELEQLELKRLMQRGRWLTQTLPTYEEMVQVAPRSRDAQKRLERMQRQADEVGEQLGLHGSRTMSDNEPDRAREILTLAVGLSDSPAIKEDLKRIESQSSQAALKAQSAAEKRRQQRRAAEKRRQRTLASLEQKFEQAYT
ncbi:MAG: hypothetical protein ACQETD_08915, partial [Pseudomonadota bacterium]